MSDICGRQALIPRSLKVEPQYDQKVHPLRDGGFSEVWRGRHDGKEVAVKVFRAHLSGDLEQVITVGYSQLFMYIEWLTVYSRGIARRL